MGWWSVMSLDLWFINAIIMLYIFSPLLYKLLCVIPKISFFIIFLSFLINGLTIRERVGYDWFSSIGILAWIIERLPVFSVGMFLAIRKDFLQQRIMYISSVSLLIAVLLVMIKKLFGVTLLGMNVCISISLAFGVISLTMIGVELLKIMPVVVMRLLNFIGKHSLEIYLVHEFVFCVFFFFLDLNQYFKFFLSFLLTIIIAYLCKSVICYFERVLNVDSVNCK